MIRLSLEHKQQISESGTHVRRKMFIYVLTGAADVSGFDEEETITCTGMFWGGR